MPPRPRKVNSRIVHSAIAHGVVAELERFGRDMVDDIRASYADAMTVIRGLMMDPETPPMARLNAAKYIADAGHDIMGLSGKEPSRMVQHVLQHVGSASEIDIESRTAGLEAKLQGDKDGELARSLLEANGELGPSSEGEASRH